jgi:hypothetical protein
MLLDRARLLTISGAVALLAGCFGRGDADLPIANGYLFSDAGGYEKLITYRGDQHPRGIVIDARVDDYRVDGERLIVARTPRVTVPDENGNLDSKLVFFTCEYWQIDLKTHRVTKIDAPTGIRCR